MATNDTRTGRFLAINEHMLPIMAPLFDNNGDGGGGDGGAGGGGGPVKDAAYWEAEAKKAFQARDAAKGELKKLEGKKILTEEEAARYQELQTQAEQAEEERKKKAGEFDQWRTQIADKHAKELEAERKKIAAEAEARTQAVGALHSTLIGLSFAGASEWFGSDGKTVLPADVAQSYFGKYVEVQDENGVRTVIVKNLHGEPILDTKTGRPAPFAKAIGELIDSMPGETKNRILRGSGKAGSGNAGGGAGSGPIDIGDLSRRAAKGDAEAVKQLRAARPSTGITMGEAYS